MASELNDTLCIPMKLDAFVFNTHVCSSEPTDSKIAPITQPNYSFLRLHDPLIQSDVLPHVDIHNSFGPTYNSRITNIDTGKTYVHRQGVYLHWMLPRVYRSGTAATQDSELNRDAGGLPHLREPAKGDQTAPEYRPVPTRWLIIRRLRASSPAGVLPEYESWVVESDSPRSVDEDLPGLDLQVDVSPYIKAPTGDKQDIHAQAQSLIGKKTPVASWKEPTQKAAPLTVLNGGNILFPDFQQHNGNVFSILDNFASKSENGIKYLESATADYYVIGWHASSSHDPMHISSTSNVARETRLGNCQMVFNAQSKHAAAWSAKKEEAHTLCHGAMYSVKWNINSKPPKTPADDLCRQLQQAMPVAVGTTPLDSLLAYVRVHQKDAHDADVKKVMQAILSIQKYLLVQEDTVDGHEQADDLLYNYNYDAVAGGIQYHIAGAIDANKPTQKPSQKVLDAIAHVNREQYRLDSLTRLERRLRYKMFARWWAYVSRGIPNNTEEALRQRIKCNDEVKAIWEECEALKKARTECSEEQKKIPPEMHGYFEKKVIEATADANFYLQRDPTMLVGNIQSSWPHDWLDALKVRLNVEVTAWSNRERLGTLHQDVGIPKLPTNIQDTATALVQEFLELSTDSDGSKAPPTDTFRPLYHDDAKVGYVKRRDRWGDSQPFFPLFLEWEAEYSHIDYKDWSLEERSTTASGSAKLSYGISGDEPLHKKWQAKPKEQQDLRVLSGRSLILPQPSFSLKSQIQQVHDQTADEKLKETLKKALEHVDKLTYLSSPLAGFHDHLLTMSQGTHIKPTIRLPGEALAPIEGAEDEEAGFQKERFTFMGTETDLTPYAALVHLSKKTGESPFKPVTHGQFKFTKLNIIDKFGQVIHALNPQWNAQPQNILPCLSEYYAPQALPDGRPNIVEPPAPQGNHYVQVPPHMNQWAKVNAKFMKRTSTGWIPQNEWDNPIWGWIVYNYLDFALQIFLPDGRFYREVAIGGEFGTRTSEKWLPFKETEDKKASHHGQLDRLIHELKDEAYLNKFMDMVRESMDHAAPAPDAYAQFLNSIVGRPLALVNMGWSLELATNEYTNQSSNNKEPSHTLLPKQQAQTYRFPFKLGDQKRSYDGLVGYFKTADAQGVDNYLNLSKCYTFFGVKDEQPDDSLLVKIKPKEYPVLDAFFVDPVKHSGAYMEATRNKRLAANTFGAIIDPFNPVHGYTGILPIQPLKLPGWTWQDAMSRMTAFFHIGPLTVTKDVPDYQSKYLLTAKSNIQNPGEIIDNAAGLPTMGPADWAWLQPYNEKDKDGQEETVYMPLGLAKKDIKPAFEEGPYTSIEGFLQLRVPIVRN